MITHLYDPNARKKPTNLSLNIDLLRQVRDLRINLSKTLEQCLAQMLSNKLYCSRVSGNRCQLCVTCQQGSR